MATYGVNVMNDQFRKVLPVLCGNILETYDFCLYGLLAPVFAKIFFPENFKHSLLATFLVFSMAYIARPFGAIFWGIVADRYGRKSVLLGTISLMAICAVGMAIMPSYAYAGSLICILVIILRILQGIAFGGEFPTVIVTLYELAPDDKKGFYGSFADGIAIIGYLAGIIILIALKAMLTESQLHQWGWRLMFGLSVVFVFIVGWIRRNLSETIPSQQSIFSLTDILRENTQNIASIGKIFLYMFAPSCLFFNFVFYIHAVIGANNNLSNIQISIIHMLIVILFVALLPTVGFFSDKINRSKLLKYSYIVLIIVAIPLYQSLFSSNTMIVIIAYVIFAIFTAISVSTFVAIIVRQAPENSRVTSVGIGHSIAVIFGSFTPSINTFLTDFTDIKMAPALYIVICALISVITLAYMKNSQEYKHGT
ncbi:MFS transporter [Cysteiniphilum sp. 6C5]|uniref:MFS transporter n=1 Tax=unclassified Cysteiniphilum TaxID=2610889 RepID=UPI003F876B4C